MRKFKWSDLRLKLRNGRGKNFLSRLFFAIWDAVKKILRTRAFWRFAGAAAALFLFFVMLAFAVYSRNLPDPDRVNSRLVAQSTKILDREGRVLYDIFGEAKRTLIGFDEMPQNIKEATVAIEDKDFYKHHGIDFTGILRSFFRLAINFGPEGGGGSTLTQQFIKNALLTNEKVFSRKIKEAVLAIQIERKFSKDEILKLYLNEVPYGNNAYGIEAAAQTYFAKSARDLTLAESAYLAALPQAPTALSPYGPNRDRLDGRKNTVLAVMEQQGYITSEEREAAMAEGVVFSPVRNSITAPHFVLYIQDLLVQKYGETTLRVGGLQITTSLDLDMQRMAEEAVAEKAETNASQYSASNAALVALDPNTGEVLAWVGSRDYFNDEIDGQVNVPLRPRQPGSSFKPYVYATAFKKGYSPASMIMDVTTNFGEFGGQQYIPQNYNNKVVGPISMRSALAGSLNIPAVKTILLVGVRDSIRTARDMGITTLTNESQYGPSLVLGAGEVTLFDHVSAYGVFATGGIRHEPVTILKIADAEGKILEEHNSNSGQRVLDAQVAFLMNSVLSDNNARAFTFGTSNFLTLPGRIVAAKTGTTQASRDAWTVGYTPQLVAGVWAGNNNNDPMRGAGGGSAAAPIWNSFMRKATAEYPAVAFSRPEKIRDIRVDEVSGKLPTRFTPTTKPEVFADFADLEDDDIHLPFDKTTGKLADSDAPLSQVDVYTVLRSEKPDDENWERPVREWAIANGFTYPGIESGVTPTKKPFELTVSTPQNNAIITELPMIVSAEADSEEGIRKITIFLDGKEIFSDDANDISFFYSGQKPDGVYILRVVAEDRSGLRSEEVRSVTFALGNNLLLTEPEADDVIFFPHEVRALANSQVSSVEFFFQKIGNATPVRIAGNSSKQTLDSGLSEFRLVWQGAEQPEAGEYEIFAQSNDGKRSKRVKIIIP